MIPIWIGKMVAKRVFKGIKHKIDLNKIDKYVNEENNLDKQMVSIQRNVIKNGQNIEELEKDVATLKKDSHPPIFSTKDIKDNIKRLKKLEKKN